MRFAPVAGVVNTLEGPVAYSEGDAIVTGVAGEQWSVARERFHHTYAAIFPTESGQDGRYVKHPHDVLALRLTKGCAIHLADGRGTLHGRAGDYLVQYRPGDCAVVAAEIFDDTYER